MDYEYSRSDYLKALLNQKKALNGQDNNIVNPSIPSDIESLALMNTNTQQMPEQQEQPSDEKDKRNWWQRTIDTAQDFVSNINTGISGFADSIFDATMYAAGGIGKLFGNDTQWAQDLIQYNWEDYATNVANNLIGFTSGGDFLNGNIFDKDYWSNYWTGGTENINKLKENSFVDYNSDGGQFYGEITQGIGNVLPSIVLGFLTGGSSTAVQVGVGLASAGVQGFGAGTEQALSEGATFNQAGGSGLISAGIEVATEGGSMGIGAIAGKIAGKSVSLGTHIAGQKVGESIAKLSIKELGTAALEEGTEEFISEILSPLSKLPYKNSNEVWKEYGSSELYTDALKSFVVGGVGGAFGTGVSSVYYKAKYTQKGIDAINDVREVSDLHNEIQQEIQKGNNANNDLIQKGQERIGELTKKFETEMAELEQSNPGAYKEVCELLADPKRVAKNITNKQERTNELGLLKNTEYYENALKSNYDAFLKNLNADDYQIVANGIAKDLSGITNNDNLNVQIGTEEMFNELNTETNRTNKAFIVQDNIVYVDPRYKTELYSLITHEALGHATLDLDENVRNNLINAIESNETLNKEFHKFDAEIEKAYENASAETITSERLAKFLESVITDQKSLDKLTQKGKSSLSTLLDNVINKLNPNRDSDIITKLRNAINEIDTTKRSQNNDTLTIRFARDVNENRVETLGNTLKTQIEQALRVEVNNNVKAINTNVDGVLYKIYDGIDNQTFYSAFSQARQITANGELVDLHPAISTNDEIGYDKCRCFLSDDGLSGMAITPDGDLISVFNANPKGKWLRSIANIVKENVKTLDCYVSNKQNLMQIYEHIFGFKTASIMEWNELYDHDNIGANHSNPSVAFMVNVPYDVETKNFSKNDYDGAKNYQLKVLKDQANQQTFRDYMAKPKNANDYQKMAQGNQEQFVSVASVQDVYVAMQDTISQALEIEGLKITNKSNKAFESAAAFNTLLNKPEKLKVAIREVAIDILESEVSIPNENGTAKVTLRQFIKDWNVDETNLINDWTNQLTDAITEKSKPTKIKKLDNFYKSVVGRLVDMVRYQKQLNRQINTSMNNSYRIFNKLSKNKANAEGIGNRYSATLTAYIKAIFTNGRVKYNSNKNSLSSNNVTTIINNLSEVFTEENITRLGGTWSETDSNGNKVILQENQTMLDNIATIKNSFEDLTQNSIDRYTVRENNLLDKISQTSNESELEELKEKLANVREKLEELKAIPKEEHKIGLPNRALTLAETEAFAQITSFVNKQVNEFASEEYIAGRKAVFNANSELNTELDAYAGQFARENWISRQINESSSVRALLSKWFGKNSEIKKILYDDIMDAYAKQQLKSFEFMSQVNDIMKVNGLLGKFGYKQLNKKVKLTVNGITYNLSIGYLMDIYAMSQTTDGLNVLTDGGYAIKRKNETTKFIKFDSNSILEVEKSLTQQQRQAALDILNLYNTTLKEYKAERDASLGAVVDVLEDSLYYPLNRAEMSKIGQEKVDNLVIRLDEQSFNKQRTRNTKHAARGMMITDRVNAYINGITKYGEMTVATNRFSNFLNGYTDNTQQSRLSMLNSVIPNFQKYIEYLADQIYDRPVDKSVSGAGLSNIVQASLYGNVSVVLKQLASNPTILNSVHASSYFKSINKIPNIIKNWSYYKGRIMALDGILAQRWTTMEAVRAESLSQNVGKLSRIFGLPMEFTDEFVIMTSGLASAMYEAELLGYGKVNGTEAEMDENFKAAIPILRDIVLNTQSNSVNINMSMNRAGATGTMKKVLSYFTSDLQNKISRANELFGAAKYAKLRVEKNTARLESTIQERDANQQELNNFIESNGYQNETAISLEEQASSLRNQEDYDADLYKKLRKDAKKLNELQEAKETLEQTVNAIEKQLESDKKLLNSNDRVKELAKYVVSVFLSALMVSGIDELVKRLYGRKGWTEDTTKDFITNLLFESTVNNLPYVSQIINAVEYDNDIGSYDFTALNTSIDLLKTIKNNIENGNTNWSKTLWQLGLALSNITGFPLNNLYNLIIGGIKNFSPEGYKIEALTKGYSSTYILSEYKDAAEKGLNYKTKGYLDLLEMNKTPMSNKVKDELITLTKADNNALPRDYMTKYTNDKGIEINLTNQEIKAFKQLYDKADISVSKLINITEYRKLNNEDKAKLIKKIYDTYYSYAKAKVLKTNGDSKLSNLLLFTNGNVNIGGYTSILNTISNIKETKNKTRKELVVDYINKLNGYSKQEKLLIMYLAGYSVSGINQSILVNYLKQKGMSVDNAKVFLGIN